MSRMMPGGLVGARFGAEADGEAVPAIDRNKGKGQIRQFRLVKRLAYLLVQLIRYVAVGNESYSLRPGQGCAFAFSVIGGFAPGHQPVKSLLAFSPRTGIFPVHVDTVGTAVDLRGTQLDQFKQRGL